MSGQETLGRSGPSEPSWGGAYVPTSLVGMYAPGWSAPAKGRIHHTTEPQRILETVQSRCLRLNFAGEAVRPPDAAPSEWLAQFGALAATEQKSLLGRYRLLDVLLQKLGEIRARVDESLTARSPLQRYEDVDKDLRERWEDELAAAIRKNLRLDFLRLARIARLNHRHKESLYLAQHFRSSSCVVNRRPQLCPARHTVRKPRGELFHLALRVAHPQQYVTFLPAAATYCYPGREISQGRRSWYQERVEPGVAALDGAHVDQAVWAGRGCASCCLSLSKGQAGRRPARPAPYPEHRC